MPFFRAVATPDTYRAPLSGDVSQVINPWSWMLSFAGSQFNLFSVNLGRSSDPDLEAEILDKVGSYGSQLGQIGDVLEILIKRIPPAELCDDERKAIIALQYQLNKIEALKANRSANRAEL